MSNAENSETAVASASSVVLTGASAGTQLRQAREAAGLHIAALAVSMKVPVKKLEALEADRLDLLPDAVFARALASSMCRTLKIDPTPVLDRLPTTKKVSLTVEARAANEPFNKSTYSASGVSSMKIGKPALWIVVALFLGIALILFVPATPDVPAPQETAVEEVIPNFTQDLNKQPVEEIIVPMQGAEVPAAAPVTPASAPVIPPTAVPNAINGSVAPMTPVTPVMPAPVAPPVVQPVAPAVPALKQDSGTAPAPVSVNSVVAFKVRGPSWVEVTDAKGVVQLRRNLNEGEQASASGTLPMVVVVGRVDVTDVAVRGKPFDLSKLAVGNVARFEVK